MNDSVVLILCFDLSADELGKHDVIQHYQFLCKCLVLNHCNVDLVSLGFEKLQEHYEGNYNLIQGNAVVWQFRCFDLLSIISNFH